MRTPDSGSGRRDDWTGLDAPDAAAAAIAKLEKRSRTAAEIASRRRCLDLLELRSGHRVLDVGSGTGRVAIEIAHRVGPAGRVVALDPSPALGAHARQAATREGVGNIVQCQVGRAETLPFPNGAFDRSFCRWLLLHVDAAEAVIGEMRRVTRPGGRLMCVEADWETVTVHPGDRQLTRRILNFCSDRHIEGWSGRRLVPLLRACGIAEVAVEPSVIIDHCPECPQWVSFLHERARLAAAAGAVSEAEAAAWREAIDRAVAQRRYFFSVTQFVVRGDI